MPRKKRTQTPQTPGLEAGAAYGEVGDSLAAQDPNKGGIPLPAGGGSVTAAPPPQQRPLPVDAARGFNPQVTPLTAPGEGRNIQTALPRITPEQRSADLLRKWAVATGDPIMAQSAQQLGQL